MVITKFEFHEQELPTDKADLLYAWDEAVQLLAVPATFRGVNAIASELAFQRLGGSLAPDANLNLIAEQQLATAFPEVAAATQGLKRSLDKFIGRSISFEMMIPKQWEMEPDEGYLLDTKVGYDFVAMSGLNAYLKIGPEPKTPRGIWYGFDSMQRIQFDV